MQGFANILIAVVVLGLFFWLITPPARPSGEAGGQELDPADPFQIGMIVGALGGGVADAATVRFALQRFEETYGRPATTQDVGAVVGLMGEIGAG